MKKPLWFFLILLLSFTTIIAQESIFLNVNPYGHKATIRSLAVSSDKKTLVTAGLDKIIKIWDIETASLSDEIYGFCGKGMFGSILSMSLSPDNKYLAVAGIMSSFDPLVYNPDLGNIRVYDFETRKLAFVLQGPDEIVNHIAFSNDSKKLLVLPNNSGKDIQIWDIASRQVVKSYKYSGKPSSGCIYNNLVYCGFEDGSISRFNLLNDADTMAVHYHEDLVADIRVSGDGSKVVSGSLDMKLIIADPALKILQVISNNSGVASLSISDDSRKIICGRSMGEDSCNIYQSDSKGKYILWKSIVGFGDLVRAVGFAGENKVVLAGGRNHQIMIADLSGNMQQDTKIIRGKGVTTYAVGIAELSNNLICFSKEKNAGKGFSTPTHVFDIITHEIQPIQNLANTAFSIPRTKIGNLSLVYSSGAKSYNYDSILNLKAYGKQGYLASIPRMTGHKAYTLTCDSMILSGGREGALSAYDFTGKQLARFDGHISDIYGLAATQKRNCSDPDPEKYWLASCSADQVICIWDLKQVGKKEIIEPIASVFFTEDNEWIIWSPDGYFTSSRNGSKYIGYIVNAGKDKDSRYFPFDQFDLKFNRPDIILDRLGVIDPAMKEAYFKAYLKRITKMGFDTLSLSSDLHVPLVETGNLSSVSKSSVCKIPVKANDPLSVLDRINVYVNGVPLYGMNGLSLKNRKLHNYNDSLEIQLNSGNNLIQVSALNSAGAESLKETRHVFYNNPKPVVNTVIIAVGVSKYLDSKHNLNFAAKDASDFSEGLAKYETLKNNETLITTMLFKDEKALRNDILNVKSYLKKETKPDDKVFVFFAGHGLLDRNFNFFIATHDINFSNPSAKGIGFDELESILDGIPARKKILLIDACQSGEVDRDENYVVYVPENDSNVVSRSAVLIENTIPLSEKSSYNTFELMKTLFSDLRKGTGTVVFSAAGGNEFAYENAEWNNGVFTFSLLSSLKDGSADLNKDGRILVSEMYISAFELVRKLTNGAQNPTVRRENSDNDFEF
jgi:WD40 repeat protein